jgi:hypothetical protein
MGDYWPYWWGSAALLNIAIGVGDLTLPTHQMALKALTYAAIFLMICTALVRYRRAQRYGRAEARCNTRAGHYERRKGGRFERRSGFVGIQLLETGWKCGIQHPSQDQVLGKSRRSDACVIEAMKVAARRTYPESTGNSLMYELDAHLSLPIARPRERISNDKPNHD